MDLYDINVLDKKGVETSLKEYENKVLLIVNTATGCGFTPQYDGLQKLYDKYKEKGFEILDFPCNQFGNQAPGNNEEISNFCTINYGVSFAQFSKIDVNGKNEAPLYTFLKSKKGGIAGKKIKWNFTKFLIDRNGNVIERFPPITKPEKIQLFLEKLL